MKRTEKGVMWSYNDRFDRLDVMVLGSIEIEESSEPTAQPTAHVPACVTSSSW